jgi:hypothetical protein
MLTTNQKRAKEALVCLVLFSIGFPLTLVGFHKLQYYLNRWYHPYTLQSYVAEQILIGYVVLFIGLLFCAVLVAVVVLRRKYLFPTNRNQ